MFFNILAVIGLALAAQGNLNETNNTTAYAAESSYTLNCGEPVEYTYGNYSHDYSGPYLYEYDYTYSMIAPGLWATLAVAMQLVLLGAVVARRITRGIWTPTLLVLTIPFLYAGMTVAFWLFHRSAASAEAAQSSCAGIIPFVVGFAIFKMALRR
jgi:hypothetical protein